MRAFCQALILSLCLAASLPYKACAVPIVAVSIKPLHAIVAEIMRGVGTPALIVPTNQSPHDFSLRPSHIKTLRQSDAVFIIHPAFETFLGNSLAAVEERVFDVADAPGITLRAYRGGGTANYHLWLDPRNGMHIAEYVRDTLAQRDTKNAAVYAGNAKRFIARLQKLDADIAARTKAAREKQSRNLVPYIAYHDAYQYFEARYGFEAPAPLTRNPERPPGAKSLRHYEDVLKGKRLGCIFGEPQFDNAIIRRFAERYGAEIKTLDPDGATLTAGKDVYANMMETMAEQFIACMQK